MASARSPSALPEAETEKDSSAFGSDGDSDSDDGGQVEWLVQGREKRATAGNRLSTLVQQAAAEDDELNLLFEMPEDEEDEGFNTGDDNASDAQMDSSDDDEDQGPAAGAEEFEGEKELQRAERQSKKRKANDGIPRAYRKRVKIDPTAPLVAPPRPKKKLERASWIATSAEGPTRASSRKTTKDNREHLQAQIIDREKKRLKLKKSMDKAAATRNAKKATELTQEDRMKEAARIEKHNAKSLNKWEEAEKLREEDRRQKLEDLRNRTLQGPVITWWSGVAEWVDGKVKRIGKALIEEKPKTTTTYMTAKKRKLAEMEAAEAEAAAAAAAAAAARGSVEPVLKENTNGVPSTPSSIPQIATNSPSAISIMNVPNGIRPFASVAAHSIPHKIVPRNSGADPRLSLEPQSQQVMNGSVPNPLLSMPIAQQGPANAPPNSSSHLQSHHNGQLPNAFLAAAAPLRMVPSPDVPFKLTPAEQLPVSNAPPVIEHSTRNCIILENFDENAIKDKAIQTQLLFGQKTLRIPRVYKTPKTTTSKDPICVITGYAARFRDPGTGLPYCNAYAYKEIQKLKRGDYRWSSLLQAYVGQSSYAARGVPARFVEQKPVPK